VHALLVELFVQLLQHDVRSFKLIDAVLQFLGQDQYIAASHVGVEAQCNQARIRAGACCSLPRSFCRQHVAPIGALA